MALAHAHAIAAPPCARRLLQSADRPRKSDSAASRPPDCVRTGRKSCFGADRPRGDAGAAMRPPDRPRYAHGHRPNRSNPSGRRELKNPGSAIAVRRPPPPSLGPAALRCAGPAANLTGFVFDSRLQFYERSPSWTRSTFWNQSSFYFFPFLFVRVHAHHSSFFIACCSCCSCCCCSCSCC